MRALLDRRAFLGGFGALLTYGLAACARQEEGLASQGETSERGSDDERPVVTDSNPVDEGRPMQISVIVNDVTFTATIEDTAAGQELLARMPLTLSMEELHGNEKYCYTGEAFGGEEYVPSTIESGDLMVFGSDCLVLFYETFANGGWGYARVGKIDDPSGLADACGSGTAMVTFEQIS